MKRILLTGSRGFFGSRLINFWGREFEIAATNSDNLNITDKSEVEKAVLSAEPDYVVHAAAIADTAFCNAEPLISYSVNVGGTKNIADAAVRAGCRLVFLSTEQVFNGNKDRGPYAEDRTPVPDTEYGRNKLEAEKYITEICSDYLILRCTWMFGVPSEAMPVSGNILWDTIQMIKAGKPFKAEANEYRGLTYINDLIVQFSKIIDLPAGLYHAGSENIMSRYDTVCRILEELGIGGRIPDLVQKDNEKYSDSVRDVRLDTSLIRKYGIDFPDSMEAVSRCIAENLPFIKENI